MQIRKQQSHGKIGEASVAAKCWMHGIPAYNTAGLRANFAGSDLLVDTSDPTRKLLIQVKTGYNPSPDWVYMTQCAGEHELEKPKFVSDFVVFVNLDKINPGAVCHPSCIGPVPSPARRRIGGHS